MYASGVPVEGVHVGVHKPTTRHSGWCAPTSHRDAADPRGRISSYLEPARLRSSSAAHNAIPSNIRMASERDGWPGSSLRHSSIASCHSIWSRRLKTGICPLRGRPRFFRTTRSDSMRCVLQQSARTENPGSRKLPRNCCITRSHDVFHRKEFVYYEEVRNPS